MADCDCCRPPPPPAPADDPDGQITLWRDGKFRLLLLGLLLVAPLELLSLLSLRPPPWVGLPLCLGLIIAFGHRVAWQAVRSLVRLRVSDINLLMGVAVTGALYLGEWEEAAVIVVLFSLGETLEAFGVARSRQALAALAASAPKTAVLKDTGERVTVEGVAVGKVVVVKPGDQVPLDGTVAGGGSLVDEAAITGEPLPRSKHVGDPVYAGTHNGSGYLEVRVTKTARDTTLAKIIDLTERSAEKKSTSQQFIESFSRYYTPAVMAAAALTVIVPVGAFGRPLVPWLTQALTLLLISCPCALVLSTPIAVFSAIGNASRRGVLVKGGRFIEEMGRVRAVAFDKTRTLTRGAPVVSDVVPFDGYGEDEVLACAAGLEALSEHPLARSILDRAAERGLARHPFENFTALAGKGLRGECTVCTDRHHCVGSLRFITEEHGAGEEVLRRVGEFEAEGKTTIVMSDGVRVKGVIAVTDAVRPESAALVRKLRAAGVTPVMLTGDNAASARFVAAAVGIDEVRSELLPDQKVRDLAVLLRRFGHVAMVGDGMNDAPALASASVGIAMGAIGSDLAIENADIALMHDDIGILSCLVGLGRRTIATMRANIAVAVAVKALFLGLAVAGHSDLALAIFADVGVTVLVVLSSLRLFTYGRALAN